ncbi:MAG: indole-3-glycerol-phosphate synthase [Anaerolineales bacterium]|nr:indole-3-glycerol-phosphate synthase [Anaerolineales bacterium]
MLAQILDNKRSEIARLDPGEWKSRAADAAAPRGFLPLDQKRAARPRTAPMLVAEIKRASPSRGELNTGLDPRRQARLYAENGAAAISILTDEKFFRGNAADLAALRGERLQTSGGRPTPLLRKDFILAPVQLFQSRALGADAVLLIAAALEGGALDYLHALALELGLTPLVEVHTGKEFDRALRIPELRWLGVNNRNLATFEVSTKTCLELGPEIPPGIGSVAESGISAPEDARAAGDAGYDAILVGETLVTAKDPAAKVRELSSTPHPASSHSINRNEGRGVKEGG